MFGHWYTDTLRLFEVIASPIMLFGPELQISFAHGMRSSDRVYDVLARTWSRNIGEPLLLSSDQEIGGIRLPDRSIVLIGPIAPLKVTVAGQTHYLANQTALAAANLWLKLVSDFCRRAVHAQVEREPDDLAGPRALDPMGLSALDPMGPSELDPMELSALDPMGPSELDPMGPSELDPMGLSALDSIGPSASGLGEAQLEQELSQLLGLKISATQQAEPESSSTLSSVLERNFDLSRIVAAQGTAYNPFDGNFIPDVVDAQDEAAFIAGLNLGKISTVHHHNQLRNEVLMQEAVREGDLTKLRWARGLATKGQAGILGLTPLRHWQNHAHLSNVLASRAAIEAGIAPEEAYVLSDKLFLVVEQVTDPLLAKYMRFVIWRAFTEQVKRHRDELKARQKTLTALTQDTAPNASPEPVLVLKARYLMAQRLMEPLALTSIAAELACTPEHLARSFKRYHHQTVHEYLVAERLKLAKELLLESNQKVGDIAQLLHFASSSHFCAAFKEREHLSPLKWRKLHAKVFEG